MMSEWGLLKEIYYTFPYFMARFIVFEYIFWEYVDAKSKFWPERERTAFQTAYKRRFGVSLLLFEKVGVAWFDRWLLFSMCLKYAFIGYMFLRFYFKCPN